MICNTCGRNTLNEEANFCEYCGSSFREQARIVYNTAPPQNSVMYKKEKPISFISWLGSMAFLFIPVVGILVFVVMLFVWSFTESTLPSKKNWARAMLVVVGVAFVIFMSMLITMIGDPAFQKYMNEYMMNSIKNYQ
ncbi:MAG: hypothetical protein K0S47_985 [Herbinix sp.]|jgi:uncharacterized membrane protein YvbJ|nr:hypothetical protein [Herbinix sp.]